MYSGFMLLRKIEISQFTVIVNLNIFYYFERFLTIENIFLFKYIKKEKKFSIRLIFDLQNTNKLRFFNECKNKLCENKFFCLMSLSTFSYVF